METVLRALRGFWRLAVVAPVAAGAVACGSLPGQDVSAPGNQSYHFDGLTAVVSRDASAGATHYRVFYDKFSSDSCGSDGSPGFCGELAGNVVGTSTPTPARPGRELLLGGCLQRLGLLRGRQPERCPTQRPFRA